MLQAQRRYNVPFGPEHVNIQTLPSKEIQLRQVYLEYVQADPGKKYAILLDGCPIIIATNGRRMIFAHGDRASVVDEIVNELRRDDENVAHITMCIQFADESREVSFIDCAQKIGLCHVWAMNTYQPEKDANHVIALRWIPQSVAH